MRPSPDAQYQWRVGLSEGEVLCTPEIVFPKPTIASSRTSSCKLLDQLFTKNPI
jgi:hypothetical protein